MFLEFLGFKVQPTSPAVLSLNLQNEFIQRVFHFFILNKSTPQINDIRQHRSCRVKILTILIYNLSLNCSLEYVEVEVFVLQQEQAMSCLAWSHGHITLHISFHLFLKVLIDALSHSEPLTLTQKKSSFNQLLIRLISSPGRPSIVRRLINSLTSTTFIQCYFCFIKKQFFREYCHIVIFH